jgi:hypothetical protein
MRKPRGSHTFLGLVTCNRCGQKEPATREGFTTMASHIRECQPDLDAPRPAGCPYRAACTAHMELSCRESQQERMTTAIAACDGGRCFAIFARLLAGADVRQGLHT